MDNDAVNKYGIVDGHMVDERIYKVDDMVEKPDLDDAPTDVAVLGRYIITPQIFPLLETQDVGKGGEIQLTDALRRLAKEQPMYAYDFKGHRYDVGTKAGFIQANIEFALRDDALKNEMKAYLDALHQYMDAMLQYE